MRRGRGSTPYTKRPNARPQRSGSRRATRSPRSAPPRNGMPPQRSCPCRASLAGRRNIPLTAPCHPQPIALPASPPADLPSGPDPRPRGPLPQAREARAPASLIGPRSRASDRLWRGWGCDVRGGNERRLATEAVRAGLGLAVVDERLGAETTARARPFGVLGAGFGGVDHDAQVVARDDECVAVQREGPTWGWSMSWPGGPGQPATTPDSHSSAKRGLSRLAPRSAAELAVGGIAGGGHAQVGDEQGLEGGACSSGVWTARVPGPTRLRHTPLRSIPRHDGSPISAA